VNKGYTLVQLLSSMVVVLILSTVSVMGYRKMVDMGRASTCASNLKVLNDAVEGYVVENYVIPATLGNLERKHFENAYATVMDKAGWFDKFTQFIARTDLTGDAHAQFLTYDNLKAHARSKEFFVCPSDQDGGTSYGINDNIKGKRWFEIGNNVIIVGDCDSPVFSSFGDLRARHSSGRVALAITKGNNLVKVEGGVATSDDGGVTPQTTPDDTATDADHDATSDGDDASGDVDAAAASSAAQGIMDAVTALGLPHGVETSLLSQLNGVISSVQAGDYANAIDGLQQFTQKVQNDVDHGRVSAADGNALLGMANTLIGNLSN